MTSRRAGMAVVFLAAVLGCVAEGPAETEAGGRMTAGGRELAEMGSGEIRAVLDAQVEAWNRGDIPGFMEGYERTDSLRFASGGTVWNGWERTLQRYRETYDSEAAMGRLAFENLDIWMLTDSAAVVFGRWQLARSEDFADIGGLFTLIMKHGPDGWRIVHDHTSSAGSTESQPSDSA